VVGSRPVVLYQLHDITQSRNIRSMYRTKWTKADKFLNSLTDRFWVKHVPRSRFSESFFVASLCSFKLLHKTHADMTITTCPCSNIIPRYRGQSGTLLTHQQRQIPDVLEPCSFSLIVAWTRILFLVSVTIHLTGSIRTHRLCP
jgi:hypothetical protein